MNPEDEAFANCIEVDNDSSDGESEKENVNSTRTKPEQISKIISFVKGKQ